MTRQIRLSFPGPGIDCVATLLDDVAPETCNAVWNTLPVQGDTVHGRWSGPEIFIETPSLPDIDQENGIHKPLPGDLCYWMCPAGKYATSPDRAVEILLAYDAGVALGGPEGLPVFANRFATLEGDWDAFRYAAKGVRTGGSLLLRIEQVKDEI